MSFLSANWLLLLVLLVPVLLLHARRPRWLEVPSLRLWKLVAPGSPPVRRWHWPTPSLLLFLQLATVVLASLALAQPRFGEPPVDHTIFLLDVSGSMRANDTVPSRLAGAIDELRRRVQQIASDEGGRASLIAVGAQAEIVFARQTDLSAMHMALGGLRGTDGEANYESARDWIDAVVREEEATRLVLLSDSGVPSDDGFGGSLPYEIVAFGDPTTPNAGLVASLEPADAETGRWRVTGHVQIAGDAALPDAIILNFAPEGDEKGLDWGRIAIAPEHAMGAEGGVRMVPFLAELNLPGSGLLRLSIPADAGPHDDAVQFVVGPASRALRVLIVGREDPKIVRAVAALGDVELEKAEELPSGEDRFDLVIAHDVTLSRQPDTNLLLLGAAAIAGEPAAGSLSQARVSGWDPTHVLTRDVDWRSLRDPFFHPVDRIPGARVILEADGLPLIQARSLASGREVRVALDPARSGWTEELAFPVFLSRLVEWTGVQRGPTVSCIAGEPCALSAREVAGRIVGPGQVAPLQSPSASVVAVSPGSFVPARAGVYRVETGGNTRVIAVNPAPESETDLRVRAGPGEPQAAAFWPWIVAAMIAVMLTEAWIGGRGRLPASAATLLRGAALVLLAGALLRLPFPWLQSDSATIVVAGSAALTEAERAATETAARNGAGLVLAMPQPRLVSDIGPDANATATTGLGRPNLERAVQLALGLLPADRPGRIVVSGDDGAAGPELAAAFGALAARDVRLDLAPTAPDRSGDSLVDSVEAPRQAFLGDAFPLDALVYSPKESSAAVTVLQDGVIRQERIVALSAGFNRVESVLNADRLGPSLVEVAIVVDGDGQSDNDREGTIVDVTRPPNALVIASRREEGESMLAALGLQGIGGVVVEPRQAPEALTDWLRHDLVVLMNVPALEVGLGRLETLAEAVQVHGRGLLILGGEKAFGPGGYYQTPLENLSPLSSKVPHEAPVASVVFVLDRSGSMQAKVGDLTRLDIAKAATLQAASLLHEDSRLGIVAFDSEAHEILPLLESRDLEAAGTALGPVQPGGGTVLYEALSRALGMLEAAQTEVKHIIVMTDGLIEPVDFTELLVRAQAEGITISGIAFSMSDITDLLADIADQGGGAYHRTSDFRALPSILAQETLTIAGSPLKTQRSPVIWVDREAPLLANLPDRLPPVENYVTTTAKPEASVHLGVSDDNGELVPLMASWRYGNGQVLALGTHGAGSGTEQWLAMSEYPLLWAQVARHFLPATLGPGLHVGATRFGDRVELVADLLDGRSRPVPGQKVTVVDADAPGHVTELRDVGSGRYAGHLLLTKDGTSRFSVTAGEVTTTVAVHSAYPAGLNYSRDGAAEAMAVAAATGGGRLTSLAALESPGSRLALEPAWKPWIVLALAAFLAALWRSMAAARGRRNSRQQAVPGLARVT